MSGFDLRNRSRALALSPERSGIRVGSNVIAMCEEWVSQLGM